MSQEESSFTFQSDSTNDPFKGLEKNSEGLKD